jgi:hypothetical protein
MRAEARRLTALRFKINEDGKKACKRCGHVRKASAYYKDPGYKDGHDSVCKGCRKPSKRNSMRRKRAREKKVKTQAKG